MARLFDRSGSDEYLETDTAAVTAAPFTVSAWVKGISDNTMTAWFVGDKDVAGQFWSLRLRGTGGDHVVRVQIRDSGGTTNVSTDTLWIQDQWHHLAFVEASSTDHRIFLDGGNKITNSALRSPSGADRTSIGRIGNSSPSQEFDGDIGHVAMWNVALTDAEIATLAEGVSPLKVRRDALINYWPINGQSPEADPVGGLTLTVNGTPLKSEEPPIPHSIVAPG